MGLHRVFWSRKRPRADNEDLTRWLAVLDDLATEEKRLEAGVQSVDLEGIVKQSSAIPGLYDALSRYLEAEKKALSELRELCACYAETNSAGSDEETADQTYVHRQKYDQLSEEIRYWGTRLEALLAEF